MLALPMSLTSHLGDPASPVRPWFDTRLADTAPLVKDANEHLRVRDREPLSQPNGRSCAYAAFLPRAAWTGTLRFSRTRSRGEARVPREGNR